jgi:hypothetical protein
MGASVEARARLSVGGLLVSMEGLYEMIFGKYSEFYHDESGNPYGPSVKIVITLRDSGEIVVKHLPAYLAALFVLYDAENGSIYSSAHIDFGNIIDSWGGSI